MIKNNQWIINGPHNVQSSISQDNYNRMATKTIPMENKEIEATSAGMSFLGDDLLRSAIFVLQSVFDS